MRSVLARLLRVEDAEVNRQLRAVEPLIRELAVQRDRRFEAEREYWRGMVQVVLSLPRIDDQMDIEPLIHWFVEYEGDTFEYWAERLTSDLAAAAGAPV